MIKAQAQKQPPGTWIKGRNWDQNQWPGKTFPTAFMLKDVSSTHPIYLRRVDGHAAWVNDIALQKAGIKKETPDPPGGSIVKDSRGEPSGVLIDNAMGLVSALINKPTKTELLRYLELAENEALSRGITSLHDAGANKEMLDLYREQAQAQKLKLRIYAMIDGDDQALVNAYLAEGPKTFSDFLAIRSIKYFADGALGSRGALLLADYSDQKGHKGLKLIDQDQLIKKTSAALKHGFQVAIHAIGDAANRLVLNAYEAAKKTVSGNNDVRLRIEHAQLIDPSDHARFKKLNIIASMQPIHCTSDMAWAEERLGLDRLKDRAYLAKTLIDQGVVVAFGSDSPVEPINPILGLYAAVTRQNNEGLPKEGFMPKERLTMKEALSAFYENAAFAEFSETTKGRIAPGYWADFVIFNEDILHMQKSAFLSAKPWMTVVGGEIVYKRAPQGLPK